jgi:predicted acyl esterase
MSTQAAQLRIEKDVTVPMRDGVVLRADVYQPDDGQPHPVLLCRTPYDKTHVGENLYDAKRIARRGYAVVVQDVRGAFRSNGDFYPFLTDREDGYDTVEWAADQPWSNGRVGMFGGSAMGITQWLAAVEQPPHLVAIAPAVTASDLHDGWIYQSGAFMLGFALSWSTNLARNWLEKHKDEFAPAGYEARRQQITAAIADGAPHYLALPLQAQPLFSPLPSSAFSLPSAGERRGEGPSPAPYYYDWLDRPGEDGFWARWRIQDLYERVTVPVFNIGGWYDIFIGGTLRNFAGIRERGGSPQAREGSRLVVGPWFHGPPPSSFPEGWIDVTTGATQQDVDLH